MAVIYLGQTPTTEHRLLRIDVKPGDKHTNYYLAHCSCGWKMGVGVVEQHFAEGSWTKHAEDETAKLSKAERKALFAEQLEDLLSSVWECEQAWREEDRIDTAVRYSR